MENTLHRTVRITRDSSYEFEDPVSTEEPLEIILKLGPLSERITKNLAITMRTPGCDEDLVIGFLFSEGIIQQYSDVLELRKIPSKSQPEDILLSTVLVELSPNVDVNLTQVDRNFFATSSCGICGKTSMDSVCDDIIYFPRAGHPVISRSVLLGLKDTLDSQKGLFSITGSMHSAIIFDSKGTKLHVAEDIGRHNALDKAIGHFCKLDKLPLNDHILLLSGRISFELVQKSLRGGIPVIAAIGAPSSAAIKLADMYGVTLLGFLRSEHLNCYVDQGRISK